MQKITERNQQKKALKNQMKVSRLPFSLKSLEIFITLSVSVTGLKHKLIHLCIWIFLFPPVTSRKPKVDERDGQMYSFMTRNEMECDIKNARFLEHGEYDGNLYGTKINSIHEVIETGKICILDVNPQVEPAHRFFHVSSLQLFLASIHWCNLLKYKIVTSYVHVNFFRINQKSFLMICITHWN